MAIHFNIKKNTDFDNISYNRKFIFIHVPKNAGTSIAESLGINISRHYTVNEYVAMLGPKKYNKMFSFAIVRNPFSRFISLYNYARLEDSYYHSAINPGHAIYGKHMDYEALKDKSIEEAAYLLKDGKLKHNPPHIQWKPQSLWLKNNDGVVDVKYLGKFENLDFDMRNIFALTGVKNKQGLKKLNVTSNNSKNYRKLINSTTRTILEEYYQEDLETFNYNF